MENGKNRKFGCLPGMLRNYHCQLDALKSEFFSERMISVANRLSDTQLILLNHNNIDKMVVLRISKRFLERARRKYDFTPIMFHVIHSDECASTNEDWKYYVLICYYCHKITSHCSMKFFVLINIILIYLTYLIFIFNMIHCSLFYT